MVYATSTSTIRTMEKTAPVPDNIKQLEARFNEIERGIIRSRQEKNDKLNIQLQEEYREIKKRIIAAYDEWYADSTQVGPGVQIPDELHFFRYGKIDRLKQSQGAPFVGIQFSLEYSFWPGVQECYNELPEELKLPAADLLSWGMQHTRGTQLPPIEDLQSWLTCQLGNSYAPCCALVIAYMKHFGDRFVVKITRSGANQSS